MLARTGTVFDADAGGYRSTATSPSGICGEPSAEQQGLRVITTASRDFDPDTFRLEGWTV